MISRRPRRTVRGDPAFRGIPIIAMLTSSRDPIDRRTAAENGANDYFEKPFRVEEYVAFFDALAGGASVGT